MCATGDVYEGQWLEEPCQLPHDHDISKSITYMIYMIYIYIYVYMIYIYIYDIYIYVYIYYI